MAELAPDREVRARAVRTRDRNVVVLAGAGSGKTTLIVERILDLLLAGDALLPGIAAITFTEAAAAELLERVTRGLEARCGPGPEGRRARAAVEALPRAAIATIHALCLGILRRHPFAAGLGPRPEVSGDAELARRAPLLWRDALAAISVDPRASESLEGLLRLVSPADVERLFHDLLEARLPVERWLREGIPSELDPPEVAMLDRSLRDVGAAPGVEELRRIVGAPEPPSAEALRRAVALLLPAAAAARDALAREGRITFDEILVRTRDLLRDHPQIRRQEGARLSAILVDEFQDTDPVQYEVVFFLVEEAAGAAAADAWDARPVPGKLFVVGDPKQSVYRFRGADGAASARAIRHVLAHGGIELALTASFRAPDALLAPLDALLAPFLPPRDAVEEALEAAPPYQGLAAARPAPDPSFGPEPRVEVWSVPARGAAGRRRHEAAAIAEEIATRVAAGGRARDHAILLRAFSDVATYARELRLRGIGHVLEGAGALYARREVRDLCCLVRAVAVPGDELALLAFLRSAAGAVPDAELAAHRESGGSWDAAAPAPAEGAPGPPPAVARAFALLRHLREEVVRLPVDAAVPAIVAEARLLAIHAAAPDGAQRVANLRKMIGVAIELGREGRALSEVAEELEGRLARRDEEGEPALASPGGTEQLDAVRLATIHRMKGREADVVFVADMARVERAEPRATGISQRGGALAIHAASAGASTRAYEVARACDRIHVEAEERRLLYVAATRARERLVLLAAAPSRTAPSRSTDGAASTWMEALRAWGYDAAAPPGDGALLAGGRVLHRIAYAEGTRGRGPSVDVAAFVAAARRHRAIAATARRRAPIVSATSLRGEGSLPPLVAFERRMGLAVGLAIHRVLELGDLSDPLSLAAPGRCDAALAHAVREHAVDPDELRAAVSGLLERMGRGTLLSRVARCRVLARELPLLASAADGTAVRGIADLVLEEEGAILVADWKTDLLPEEELPARAEAYRPQIGWYASALSRALGRDVRAELFFVAMDRAVVLE